MIKYKALITDMDGTLVPLDRDGIPTPKVAEAVKKAKEKIHVGIATGRPPYLVLPIAHSLELTGPAIVQGGARVIDLKDGSTLYEQAMLREDCEYILQISKEENVPLIIDSGENELTFNDDTLHLKALGLFSVAITKEAAERMQKRLIGHPTVITHIVESWTKGMHQILLSHTAATKQHGIYEAAKILTIDPSEIIGVGDGGNDFPLLMACGLKVAMGNAGDDLKAIADYIAPSVHEDGLAHVIEKFILNK